MTWAFWIFLSVACLCASGLVAQWRHQRQREEISDKRYKLLTEQLGVTQRAFARLSRVVKPVVIKTLGAQKAGELLGPDEG